MNSQRRFIFQNKILKTEIHLFDQLIVVFKSFIEVENSISFKPWNVARQSIIIN